VTSPIRAVGVVVPVHNEEELLPGCLAALTRAATRSPVPVRTIVVLDDCDDASELICRRGGAEIVVGCERNVGQARSIGADLALTGESCLSDLWLANTDADTRVGPDWLADQVELADQGADAVLGIVRLADVGPHEHLAYRSAYHRRIHADGSHDHVHGANLGIRASAYRQAGGFAPLTAHEDRHLMQRLDALPGLNIVRSIQLSVETSARLSSRCPEGFAATLARSRSHPA